MNLRIYVLMALALGIVTSSALAQAPSRLSFDFNTSNPWPHAASYANARSVVTALQWQAVGSYDTAGSKAQSKALLLTADATGATPAWSAGLTSGRLAVQTHETNLGKLTLSFDLSASQARPVTVKISSYSARGAWTGTLETAVYPAAPDFMQRYALDLSTMKPFGVGTFVPIAPNLQIAFEIGGATWPQGKNEIRVDNVNYSGPAFYVSPLGNDQNNGQSETSAFATPQKALNEAQPGDIVLLMAGTYQGGLNPVTSFPRGGTPAAWIVLKNYPGQQPTLTGTGWNIVSIAKGNKAMPSTDPALAYLEVRGLHIRGEGDVAKAKYPDAMNKPDSRTNTNGIAADGRFMKNAPHHLRFADNLVEYCPAQGLGAIECDWVSIENNISRDNCWTTIYATSGISLMGATNFDGADNIYKMLIRNNTCYRNETFEIWQAVKHPSDGNGIILDVNQKTDSRPTGSYVGRTLVQSNLCYDNGGSGIHTVRANRVDIINNTAYLNSASKSLEYSQIFTYGSDDVRIINNILVAPIANVAAGEKPEPVNKISGKNTNVVFSHNLYFGGNIAPALGTGDQIGDPLFVNPSRDPQVADFHLKASSPALGAAVVQPFSPWLDIAGKPRGAKPDEGAYQH